MCKALPLLALLSLSLYPCALRAQTTNGSITGRVTDPSKATIPDAKIAAVNAGTNFRYETVTNGAGEYTLANLPPGTYRIEVEKSGFKKLVRPDVSLHVTLCAGDRSFAANSLHAVQIGKVYLYVTLVDWRPPASRREMAYSPTRIPESLQARSYSATLAAIRAAQF